MAPSALMVTMTPLGTGVASMAVMLKYGRLCP